MEIAENKELVIFDWGASTYFGWGVYGLNLMLNWALRSDFEAVCSRPIDPSELFLNSLEAELVEPAMRASGAVHERRESWGLRSMQLPALVLHSLGNQLFHSNANGASIFGEPTIGVVFSESTSFDDDSRERAKRYPLIVAGSLWNREVLVANGIGPATTILQGVDTTKFHPGPRLGLFQNRFVVFSGGKLESRKGQDLVVEAFRIFAGHHRDALLLTAWCSPWPQLARTLQKNQALTPIRFDTGQNPDTLAWTQENGIPAEQVHHLGPVPHLHLPRILREADIALFPNRAEAGTNLVAMECMACGVPAILSANTGHLDLIREGNCYPLMRQKKIDEAGCDGWGSSDVDEIVATLESAYSDRQEAVSRGRRGSEFMSQLSWGKQLGQLAEAIYPYSSSSRRLAESPVSLEPRA